MKLTPHDSLGKRLALYRHLAGVSQEALATSAGLSLATIKKIEWDQGNPSIKTLRALATALDVTCSQLLGESPLLDTHYDEELTHA